MLIGTMDTVYSAIPHIQAGGRGGSIIMTSSTNGLVGGISEGNPGVTGYSAATRPPPADRLQGECAATAADCSARPQRDAGAAKSPQ